MLLGIATLAVMGLIVCWPEKKPCCPHEGVAELMPYGRTRFGRGEWAELASLSCCDCGEMLP